MSQAERNKKTIEALIDILSMRTVNEEPVGGSGNDCSVSDPEYALTYEQEVRLLAILGEEDDSTEPVAD